MILVTEFMDEAAVATLSVALPKTYAPHLDDNQSEIPALMSGVQALVVRNRTAVNEALFRVAPYLRLVGRLEVSLDHVHVFLCVLAFHVEWHLRRRLAPLLFEDDDREGARAQRTSPVAPAKVSESAKLKAATKMTSDGLPVHSLTTLLADLATLTLNEATVPSNPDHHFPVFVQPTPLQSRAFKLLEIEPAKFLS